VAFLAQSGSLETTIANLRSFISAARAVALQKPIIVARAGR